MNNMFRGFPTPPPMNGGGSPMMNPMNIMSQIQQLKNNPNGIFDLLKNSGRLNNEQLQAIRNMKSPEEIGQYLMGNVPQNMRGQMQSNVQNVASRFNIK